MQRKLKFIFSAVIIESYGIFASIVNSFGGSAAQIITNLIVVQMVLLLVLFLYFLPQSLRISVLNLIIRKPTDPPVPTRTKLILYIAIPVTLLAFGFSWVASQSVEKYIVNNYGTNGVATIQAYRYYIPGAGWHWWPYETTSPLHADYLSVDLAYGKISATVVVSKYDAAAQKISAATHAGNAKIPVRYLPWFPQIVFPTIMLTSASL